MQKVEKHDFSIFLSPAGTYKSGKTLFSNFFEPAGPDKIIKNIIFFNPRGCFQLHSGPKKYEKFVGDPQKSRKPKILMILGKTKNSKFEKKCQKFWGRRQGAACKLILYYY